SNWRSLRCSITRSIRAMGASESGGVAKDFETCACDPQWVYPGSKVSATHFDYFDRSKWRPTNEADHTIGDRLQRNIDVGQSLCRTYHDSGAAIGYEAKERLCHSHKMKQVARHHSQFGKSIDEHPRRIEFFNVRAHGTGNRVTFDFDRRKDV